MGPLDVSRRAPIYTSTTVSSHATGVFDIQFLPAIQMTCKFFAHPTLPFHETYFAPGKTVN